MRNLGAGADAVIGAVCRGVLYLTMGVIFVVLTANVVLRYAAGTSLQWASEVPELLFPWLIMSGVVLAAQHGSHIAVVVLTRMMPAGPRRWVLAGGTLATATCYLVLAWVAIPQFSIAADELTPILRIPGSVTVGCLLAGFALLAVVSLLRIPDLLSGEAGADPAPEAHRS